MDFKPGDLPPPGIYFGLDESIYHSAPALGSSGVMDMLISPLDCWVNSRLNPDYVDEKTKAMIIGSALHRRLLEPDRFQAMYACAPDIADYPGAVDGGDNLKALCKELGLKVGGKISDLCERLLDADPNLKLWPVIKAEALKEIGDKILLSAADAADIERAAKFVTAHPTAAKAITGGQSEVSVFWLDEETGLPLKCRPDYMKTKAAITLKSFTNSLGKPITVAAASAVALNRYHVQEAFYMVGVEQAKKLLRTHKSKVIHVYGDAVVSDDWLLAFAACERHAHIFLFIEQGPVTNVLMREFQRWEDFGGQGATENSYWSAGMLGVREGIKRYAECAKRFPKGEPWIVEEPLRAFQDIDFPLYMMDAPK